MSRIRLRQKDAIGRRRTTVNIKRATKDRLREHKKDFMNWDDTVASVINSARAIEEEHDRLISMLAPDSTEDGKRSFEDVLYMAATPVEFRTAMLRMDLAWAEGNLSVVNCGNDLPVRSGHETYIFTIGDEKVTLHRYVGRRMPSRRPGFFLGDREIDETRGKALMYWIKSRKYAVTV